MQTQRNQEWVEHRDSESEDEWHVVVHPGQASANAVTSPHTERADEEGGQWDNDEHGEERNEHHVDGSRNDLLEEAVDQRCYISHHQRHEDVAAVIRQLHGHAKDWDGALFGAQGVIDNALNGRVLSEVEELRGEQRCHDGGRDPRVDAQLLASVVSHHQR